MIFFLSKVETVDVLIIEDIFSLKKYYYVGKITSVLS